MNARLFAGLDLLSTAVVLLDGDLVIRYANPAAELLFGISVRALLGRPLAPMLVGEATLNAQLREALRAEWGMWDQNVALPRPGEEPLPLNVVAAAVDLPDARLLLEIRPIEQRLRVEREEQLHFQHQANRELIRNLAHEIRNPLGGLRGSAQLLERELSERADLREYTQVIIKEADRLQLLLDRLLTPGRLPHFSQVNVHEVCERVRSLILAEFPDGIRIVRDYDVSLPDIEGDRGQLIQAVLNIVRNAAQALTEQPMTGSAVPTITLRTRTARQVTIAKHRHRLAVELTIIDNGPGIPAAIRDRIFNPLVSGRNNGTGLGLTLAQSYVHNHQGLIECDSTPGRTAFRIVLPLAIHTDKEGEST